MRDTIETNRLTLRPFQAQDATRVAELVGDFDVARMLARVPHPYCQHDAHKWFAQMSSSRASGENFTYAISSALEGVIGAISLERRQDEDLLTLGYWLGQPYWGRGFATEAGAAILAYATEDLNEATFKSEHFVENEASGRVLGKLGFVYTGEMRDMDCLARGEKVPAREMERKKEGGRRHG